ncbi:zinc finger protein 567 isoform X1 [Cephus cinctus]|uniref:Zinc finger protein 567 isoform X1 n=1 Tax=Cephus cinctus TaxID=211228 RepID=A0AAJ7FL76_CEPCN|nr:zinc finger protein 567 isoform X1 [Cephus cinctus]
MEVEEEEARICRLCGQCGSIYIDVFGEEGTKRLLGLKIHTKINILIQEDDGLSHVVCVRCMGTLEFLCDFHEKCHLTQRELLSAKERQNLETNFNEDCDVDSDKENILPAKVPQKRKVIRIVQSEKSKVQKLNSTTNESLVNFTENENSNCDEKFEQNRNRLSESDSVHSHEDLSSDSEETEMCQSISKSTVPKKNLPEENADSNSVPSYTKLDVVENLGTLKKTEETVKEIIDDQNNVRHNSQNVGKFVDEIICTDTQTEIASNKNNDQEISIVNQKKFTCMENKKLHDSKDNNENSLETRERELQSNQEPMNSNNNPVNHTENESESGTILTDSTKSKAVPVIVKQEKYEYVRLPNEAASCSAEKPKINGTNKPTNTSPPPGDEAEDDIGHHIATSSIASSNSSPSVRESSIDNTEENHDSTENLNTFKEHSMQKDHMTQLRKSVIEMLKNTKSQSSSIEASDDPNDIKMRRRTSNSLNYPSSSDDASLIDISTEGTKDFRERRKTTDGKFGRVSELISEEQKEVIETLYHVDMTVVDNEKVYKNLTVLDRISIRCNICNTIYPRMDKCQVHIWGHLNMKPYRCRGCEFATVTVSNVRCHIRKSHLKIKPFECHLCEKRYVTAVLLEEHLNTHTGAKPYSCKLCDFSSSSRQVLSYHKTTHKPSKDVTCNICGKDFYSKGRMRAHMSIHTKNKNFMCKLCSTYLCNAEALERHCQNVHSRDYTCNICGKKVRSKKALHTHQNVHAAAKYKCSICPNVYKSSHILKEHLLKHEGIRKYKCNICEKSFAQQSHLAAHMAVHSEKRYFCPGCSRPFNRHDNMKMHTKRCEAFLANPELKNLLAKRIRTRSLESTSSNGDSSQTLNDNTLITLKTETNNDKTDVDLNNCTSRDAEISDTTDITNNKNTDDDLLQSKDNDIIRIGEVEIFPIVEKNALNVRTSGSVTIIENVLGPECF